MDGGMADTTVLHPGRKKGIHQELGVGQGEILPARRRESRLRLIESLASLHSLVPRVTSDSANRAAVSSSGSCGRAYTRAPWRHYPRTTPADSSVR